MLQIFQPRNIFYFISGLDDGQRIRNGFTVKSADKLRWYFQEQRINQN